MRGDPLDPGTGTKFVACASRPRESSWQVAATITRCAYGTSGAFLEGETRTCSFTCLRSTQRLSRHLHGVLGRPIFWHLAAGARTRASSSGTRRKAPTSVHATPVLRWLGCSGVLTARSLRLRTGFQTIACAFGSTPHFSCWGSSKGIEIGFCTWHRAQMGPLWQLQVLMKLCESGSLCGVGATPATDNARTLGSASDYGEENEPEPQALALAVPFCSNCTFIRCSLGHCTVQVEECSKSCLVFHAFQPSTDCALSLMKMF